MAVPVALIDTNVLVAGLITGDPAAPTARIVDAMFAGAFPFLLSVELLAEYRDVLLRPRIAHRHRLAEGEVDALLVGVAANAMVREPATTERPVPAEDAHVRDLLATHDAAVLVTGDQALVEAVPRHRVESPAAVAAPRPLMLP
jgi:putative PIN family toxin of toxin-antitoxin system